MAEGPNFALYVRPVKGHLVPRYGTAEYLGAHVKQSGIEWDTTRIIPLTEDYWRTYRKEVVQDLENGALTKATAEEFARQCSPKGKKS